jgi:hypothetical protein
MKEIKINGRIEFCDKFNECYNRSFTATLGDSGAFQYGNGTNVYIDFNSHKYENKLIDTRYDTTIERTVNGFKKWLLIFFKENYQDNKITFID